jgi:hypothetical protein
VEDIHPCPSLDLKIDMRALKKLKAGFTAAPAFGPQEIIAMKRKLLRRCFTHVQRNYAADFQFSQNIEAFR